uniref:Src homology 2 domain containing transforming protein D n=1 Tax=Eptatretus burgeri TaxID=7764 RepID=A0A8C4PZS0_EPTBU
PLRHCYKVFNWIGRQDGSYFCQVLCAVLAGEPDILQAYLAQRERDFEDPYSSLGDLRGEGGDGARSERSCDGDCTDLRYVPPKHRLIRVEKVLAVEECDSNVRVDEEVEANAIHSNVKPFDDAASASEAEPEPVHLYDTPYESGIGAFGGVGATAISQPEGRPTSALQVETPTTGIFPEGGNLLAHQARLPGEDPRPPEEYDQPWEWKSGRISQAFHVDVKSITNLPWPPPVGQLHERGEAPIATENEAGEEKTSCHSNLEGDESPKYAGKDTLECGSHTSTAKA